MPLFPPAGGGGLSNINISAGTLSNNLSNAVFSNSNGVSFGLSGSTITGSHNALTSQTVQTQNLVSILGSTGNISFASSNGVTFGGNNSTITASHNGLTSQSNQALSGSNGSLAFQTATFGNLNGLTFYTSNGSMVGSYTVPSQTVQTQNMVSVQGSTGAVSFGNANGVTFGFNASTITASHNALTSQSNQAFSASGGSSAFQTLNFANSNGLTFSNSNGSVVASYTVPNVPAQTNQTLGLYGVSNTTLSTSGTVDARTLSFQGAGGVSVGVSNGSVVISGVTGGAGGTTNQTGPNIAAGTQTATSGTVVFSNSNGVSFGMDNSSVVTASVAAGNTLSFFAYPPAVHGVLVNMTQTSGSSRFVQPFVLPSAVSFNWARLMYSFNDSAIGTAGTTQANTSYSVERYTTIAIGLFSQGAGANSKSLQQFASSSAGITGRTIYTAGAQGSQYTISIAKTYPAESENSNWVTNYAVSSGSIVISSNSNTAFTGIRFLDIPWASSLANGNYWLAIGASTSSASNSGNISFAGTAGMALSALVASQSNISLGRLGIATAASSFQWYPGLGVHTTNASGFTTNSIGLNSVSQQASNAQLPFQLIRYA
jgi:hypothetical protein